MFGAKKFQFYYESSADEVKTCLDKYHRLGIVDVQPWSLPEPLLHHGVSSCSFATSTQICKSIEGRQISD